MRRTRRRALPRHIVSRVAALVFGLALGVVSTLWLGLLVNWLSAGLALAANVFYVVDGELRTPTLESGCLAGISRALLLEWYGGREVDAPVDLFVNGVRFASARLLVTDDGEWAVRVEDIAPATPTNPQGGPAPWPVYSS